MKTTKFGTLASAIIGGVGSVGLLLTAGRSTPTLLLVLFIGWVILPFAVLGLAAMYSERCSAFTRTTLLVAAIVIAIASLAIYCYFAIWPLASTPARTWLIVPGVALILIASVPLAARLAKR